ncbi:hypothetical protein HUU05_06560 [candidate division KSB1 bacterium]|nr:hypothetical protein [candidate division KSB1 bacterium]
MFNERAFFDLNFAPVFAKVSIEAALADVKIDPLGCAKKDCTIAGYHPMGDQSSLDDLHLLACGFNRRRRLVYALLQNSGTTWADSSTARETRQMYKRPFRVFRMFRRQKFQCAK